MTKRMVVICVFLMVFMEIATMASAISFTISVPGYGGSAYTPQATKTDSNRASAKATITSYTGAVKNGSVQVYFNASGSAATDRYTWSLGSTRSLPYRSGYGYASEPYRLRVYSNSLETNQTSTAKGTFIP